MSERTMQFGVHYMLDGYGATSESLKNKESLKKLLLNIPDKMGMHRICEPVVIEVGEQNTKDPGGVSGFVIIAESHISFHSFPNRRFITIDIYTCQNTIDSTTLTKEFVKAFGLKDFNETVIKRGTKYPVKDII